MPVMMPRRDFIAKGGAAVAGLALADAARIASAFPSGHGETLVPWLDQRPDNPVPEQVANQLVWQDLDSRLTPNEKFFSVAHHGRPVIDESEWSLSIEGLVGRPLRFSLDDLKRRPRQEVTFTLECSGNHGFPWFTGGVGNARWAGTPVAPILEEAGVADEGTEVVFVGADAGEETVRDVTMRQNFARSMSLADAMNPANLLCYEMNRASLPTANGFPLRLIAPGWYGIANVKWMTRIEVRDRRLMNRFMARDYVTIREEQRNDETVWTETSVGRARLKSVPAKVTRDGSHYRIVGAAWGAPINSVEVQIDDGPWRVAAIEEGGKDGFSWAIWSFDWVDPAPGEHTVTSRTTDIEGNVQPAADDPLIVNKHTYWESNGRVTRRVDIA